MTADMGGEVVAALACAWDEIRARHDEVPPVVLAVGSNRSGAKRPGLGHFAPAGWSPVRASESPELQALRKDYDDALARDDLMAALGVSSQMLLIEAWQLSEDAKVCLGEVFITDEGLRGSAADVLAILLHEAAHSIAHRRGVKDTSRQGRYHNARFKALGEEVGLEVARHPVIGWSPSTLPPGTATVYGNTLAELANALDADREHEWPPPNSRAGILECNCGRWVREGRRSHSRPRAAICGVCGRRLVQAL